MPEEEREPKFYAGAYTKPLDDKRRLTIPSKWRFKGDEDEDSYLAIPMKYGAISILPPDMVKNLRQKISNITIANPLKRGALSEFLGRACSFGCDKQGRVMLSEDLMQHAGLTREAYIVGVGTTFEIWDPKRRKQWSAANVTCADESVLEDLGI